MSHWSIKLLVIGLMFAGGFIGGLVNMILARTEGKTWPEAIRAGAIGFGGTVTLTLIFFATFRLV